jgi:hypothetical protein
LQDDAYTVKEGANLQKKKILGVNDTKEADSSHIFLLISPRIPSHIEGSFSA